MKKIILIALAVLSAIGIVAPLTACGSDTTKVQAQENQMVVVQRGNIEVSITASGNLELSDKQELAFQMAGTVDEVLVQEGDTVKNGQVLARLDDSAWQDTLNTMENAVTSTQRNFTTKERALTAAQRTVETKQTAVDTAQRQVSTKGLALRQAELNLQTAQYNLEQIAQVKVTQNAVEVAGAKLTLAQAQLDSSQKAREQGMTVSYQTDAGIYDVEALRASVMDAQKLVAAAKAEWQRVITDSKILFSADIATDIANKSLAVDQAQKEVQDARQAIDDANTAIATAQNALDDATLAVDDAKTAVDDAKKSISDAQKSLDKALVKSTEIVAQFDGFITQVNATGG